MKSMKFRVHNEAHSKAIQDRLFELGARWRDGNQKHINLSCTFLFLKDGLITYCDEEDFFNDYIAKESTIDDLYKINPEKRLRLNCNHEAVISDGIVKVGCQEFTFEKIRELCRLIDEK